MSELGFYVVNPGWLALHPSLKLLDVNVLGIVASYVNATPPQECFLTNRGFCKRLNVGETAIKSSIAKLCQLGLLVVEIKGKWPTGGDKRFLRLALIQVKRKREFAPTSGRNPTPVGIRPHLRSDSDLKNNNKRSTIEREGNIPSPSHAEASLVEPVESLIPAELNVALDTWVKYLTTAAPRKAAGFSELIREQTFKHSLDCGYTTEETIKLIGASMVKQAQNIIWDKALLSADHSRPSASSQGQKTTSRPAGDCEALVKAREARAQADATRGTERRCENGNLEMLGGYTAAEYIKLPAERRAEIAKQYENKTAQN